MSTIRVDTITDEAGTGAPNFPSGINVSGGAVTGIDTNPLKYTAVSGATQALDVGSHNFFDAGTLTADTTVSFSNVPTEARWSYTAIGFNAATAFDLAASIVASTSTSFLGQMSNPWGIFIGNSGTKMYISDGGGNVFQYSLQTPYAVSSATYDNVNKGVYNPNNTDAMGLYFSSDGTQMYVSGNITGIVTQWTLSTAWDLSTASSSGKSMNLSSYVNYGRDLTFKPDGTRIYFVSQSGYITQSNLSTPWDLSTFSYNGSFLASGYNPNGIELSDDGTRMYLTFGSERIVQYALSTAWDCTTGTSLGEVSFSGYGAGTGLYLPSGSTSLYALSTNTDKAFEFATEDLAAITFPSSVQNISSSAPSAGNRSVYNFFTNDGGTTVWSGNY